MDAGRRGGFETRPYMSPDPYATFGGVLTGFVCSRPICDMRKIGRVSGRYGV